MTETASNLLNTLLTLLGGFSAFVCIVLLIVATFLSRINAIISVASAIAIIFYTKDQIAIYGTSSVDEISMLFGIIGSAWFCVRFLPCIPRFSTKSTYLILGTIAKNTDYSIGIVIVCIMTAIGGCASYFLSNIAYSSGFLAFNIVYGIALASLAGICFIKSLFVS